MPCGGEKRGRRTAKRGGGTLLSLHCEIYTLFAASQCSPLMLYSRVCKLYTKTCVIRLIPEPAIPVPGVDKIIPEVVDKYLQATD